MLKLLKKSEIDTAKAQERQREMDEGLKLAKKVDNLRSLVAEEEKSLEDFRLRTMESINQEIVAKTKEKNLLLKEVSDLQDAKAEALKPLDKEWEEIHTKQDELTAYAIKLNTEQSELKTQKQDIQIEFEKLEDEKKRVSKERSDSISYLAKAEENFTESNKALKKASEIEKSAKEAKSNVLKDLRERDAVMASKERDLAIREKDLEKKNRELSKLQIKLLDQRATLERAMARLKKK